MDKLRNNINDMGKSQVIKWEVIKDCEYNENCLSRIIALYIITTSQLISSADRLNSNPQSSTILVRLIISDESVFLNKIITIDIMQNIFPYKFSSKKKNNLCRLEELYKYISSITGNNLPKEIHESLKKEYSTAVSLFKAIT
ncbi:hypothetical protein [Wolbachia endosymbiont of Pentidionis agamae]|uniref:hypothetical protein n=1 Tax=Wolbachia endosymbiont of Pentidionis agamae TaxID=3110435 RepID=UPI002FD352CE